jgi:hypothetical protein
MGFSTAIAQETDLDLWRVKLTVSLSRAESNDLFLSGDSMVSWPVEGLEVLAESDLGLERSSMFVSEIAARHGGLALRYREQEQAERTATILRMQLAQIGIKEET